MFGISEIFLLIGLYTKNTFLGLFINVKAPWGSDPGPLKPVCNEETSGLIQTLEQFLNLDQVKQNSH